MKLFSYNATERLFVPRQFGYEVAVPAGIDELTPYHEMIQFRKKHLGNHLGKLVTGS